MIRFILPLLIFTSAFSACQSLQSLSGSNKSGAEQGKREYSEDLSSYRPVYEVPEVDTGSIENIEFTKPTAVSNLEISDTLNVVLDSIAALRLKKNTVEGFSILVHNGTNHEEALKVKGEMLTRYPETYSELVFQEPFFRVKLGKFYQELNAYALLNELKIDFPTAIIVPTTFKIVEEKK